MDTVRYPCLAVALQLLGNSQYEKWSTRFQKNRVQAFMRKHRIPLPPKHFLWIGVPMPVSVPIRYTDYSIILTHGFRLLGEWAKAHNIEVQTYPQDLEDLPEVVSRSKGRDITRRNIKYAVVMNVPETPETVESLRRFGKVAKGYPWPQ